MLPADGTRVITGWGVLINPSQRFVLSISSPLDKLSGWSTAAWWEIPRLCTFYDFDALGQLQSYFKERSWSVLQCNRCSRANPIRWLQQKAGVSIQRMRRNVPSAWHAANSISEPHKIPLIMLAFLETWWRVFVFSWLSEKVFLKLF